MPDTPSVETTGPSGEVRTRIVCFGNQKGGTGKTTTCSTFAGGLAERGYSVLIVDMDPQPGNISYTLTADRIEVLGTYELLCEDDVALEDCVQNLERYDIVAADTARLERGAVKLAQEPDGVCRLAERLAAARGVYDFVLIDTPPTTGILTVNALVAADEVIIPSDTDVASAYGMSGDGLLSTVRKVRRRLNPGLEVGGIVVTGYNARTRFARGFGDLVREMGEAAHVRTFSTPIRSSVRVKEAREAGTDLLAYLGDRRDREAVAGDYEAVIAEWLGEGTSGEVPDGEE